MVGRSIPLVIPLLFGALPAFGQVQVDLSGIFTDDYVRNVGDTTEAALDGSGFALVTEGVAGSGRGLPGNGTFAADTNHPTIQLAATESNSGNNGVLLMAGSQVTLGSVSGDYQTLQVYSLATEGSASVRVEVSYTSGTPDVTTVTVSDWFDDPPATGTFYVIDGMDRWDINRGAVEVRADPALFGFDVNVDSARSIQSIELRNASTGNARWLILGMTGTRATIAASDDTYDGVEDQTLTVPSAMGLLANDQILDGGTGAAQLLTGPAHGSATVRADGSFDYIPTANYFGADSFTYQVSTMTGVGSATVNLTIAPVNDPPVARNDAFGPIVPGDSATLAVLINDDDGPDTGETIRLQMVEVPDAGGQVEIVGDAVVYTSRADFVGDEHFRYIIDDGNSDSTATAEVTVQVGLPMGRSDEFETDEDVELTPARSVLANDNLPAGNSLTVAVGQDVSHGTLVLQDSGLFTYTPEADYFGEDSFTYIIMNAAGAMGLPVQVDLTVHPLNDPPTAVDDMVSAEAGKEIRIDVLANDLISPDEGEALSLTRVNTPSSGGSARLEVGRGAVLYIPADDFDGTETFTYIINDGNPESTSMATVTASVMGPDQPDAGMPDQGSTNPDTGVKPDAGVAAPDAGMVDGSGDDGGGCVCAGRAGAASGAWWLLGLLLLGRRRRQV